MADTAVKTPNKRKNFGGKPGSGKKQKLDLNKTPQKLATPKQENVQTSTKKSAKKAQKTNNSPKILNPFAGTADLKSTKKKTDVQKTKTAKQNETKAVNKVEGKKEKADSKIKRRNKYLNHLKERIKTASEQDKKTLLTEIEEKIKNITDRDEVSKTAKRKLSMLGRYKRSIQGEQEISSVETKKLSKQQKKDVQQQNLQKNGKQQAKKANVVIQTKQKKDSQKNVGKKAGIKLEDIGDEDSEDDADWEKDNEETDEESGNESGDEQEDSEEEQDDEEDDDEDEQDDEEDEQDDEEDEDESAEDAPPLQEKIIQKQQTGPKNVSDQTGTKWSLNMEDLKKNDIISDSKKQRYVLFVGNIPYDTTKQDLLSHFQKCGEIKHIRIPTQKGSNKPRGFAYVEVSDAEVYQKCLSMHHTFLKGRRMNVLYTTGGKKKNEDKKEKVKVKNLKLQSMRKKGQLAGSVKETNKRSFRRKKQKQLQEKSNNEDN